MPRTDEEILARIRERAEEDVFGFERNDLLVCLPLEKANTLFEEPYEGEWEQSPRDRESLLEQMEEYMPFAWEKANDFRGLSAARSLSHYMAWTWLAGDDLGDLLEYQFYGKDNLRRICEYYGWDPDQWDDGVRLDE